MVKSSLNLDRYVAYALAHSETFLYLSNLPKAFFSLAPGWFRLNFGIQSELVDLGLARLESCLGQLRTRTELIMDSSNCSSFAQQEKVHDVQVKGRKRHRLWTCCFSSS